MALAQIIIPWHVRNISWHVPGRKRAGGKEAQAFPSLKKHDQRLMAINQHVSPSTITLITEASLYCICMIKEKISSLIIIDEPSNPKTLALREALTRAP